MPYVGWKIFAYQYPQDPAQREPISKQLLLTTVRDRFTDDQWVVETLDGGLKLGHVESGDVVKVKIEINAFAINYTDGTRTETYLLVMKSECLAWKQTELKHKKLMEQVSRRLPSWWEKVNCYVEDGEQLSLVFSSNVDPQPAFIVTPQTLLECPIPEELPPRPKTVRPRVVKPPLKRLKQRRKVNALKDLINQVEKEKTKKSKG